MRSRLNVATAQMLVTNDPESNLKTMLRFMEKAASRNSDIVCFPEACLVNDKRNVISIRRHLRVMQSKSRELSMWCIFGSYQKIRDTVRNFAFLIDREGNLVYRYAKVHLYRGEIEQGVVPGQSNRVLETDLGRIGMIICFDFAFPEFVKKLSMQGAEVIFCPSFMVDCDRWGDMVVSMPVVRAFENTSYFVVCDAVTRDNRTAAVSSIAQPEKILSKLEKKQGMLFASLNLPRIRKLKRKFRVLRD
ncbi:MAG: carbon-nitrogen hydrolase family protein [Candidatus Bathyarchaeia archaeon]